MLGTSLCLKKADGKIIRMTVNETETYDGEADRGLPCVEGRLEE